jgi:sensor c-di-GMP phosphodiesterase-like protein
MVPAQKHRVVVTLGLTLAGLAIGSLVGCLAGGALLVRIAEGALTREAATMIGDLEAYSHESHQILDEIDNAQLPLCSPADQARIGKILLSSHFLKDVGRMRDGKILCSAVLGILTETQGRPVKPDTQQLDGSHIYRNFPAFHIEDATSVTLQMGDSYVLINPFIRQLPPTPGHFTITVPDAPSHRADRLMGSPTNVGAGVLSNDGLTRVGSTYYVTRCSTRNRTCVTAFLSIAEILQLNRHQFSIYVAMGALLGATVGFFLALLNRRNRSMERQLRRAIRNDRLRMVYQPIVNLATHRIVGAEALARWTDEQGCPVAPDLFIRLDEERGFSREITKLVVRHTLNDFADALRSHPEFRLSINVAASDLSDPGFLAMLDSSLEGAEVPACSVALEITEASTAGHPQAIEAIAALRRRGHSIHIDDFGTGYSSLSYLHQLSVDTIKIDRSFTKAAGTEAVTVAILPLILTLAEALNLEVIVEGIETEAQAHYFEESSRPLLAQGWFFGYPVPACEFLRLLAEDDRKSEVSASEIVSHH